MKITLTSGKVMYRAFGSGGCTGYRAKRIEFQQPDIKAMREMAAHAPTHFQAVMRQLEGRFQVQWVVDGATVDDIVQCVLSKKGKIQGRKIPFARGGVLPIPQGGAHRMSSRLYPHQADAIKYIMKSTPGYGLPNWKWWWGDCRKWDIDETLYKAEKENDEMAMSKDRVKFYLPCRYFQSNGGGMNGMGRDVCKRILQMAFDMSHNESEDLMRNNTHGFTIVCRPSQFARFIVHRNTYGDCINGVKDLEPSIIEEYNLYDEIAETTGVDRDDVKTVALALGFSGHRRQCPVTTLDVSKRPHQACYGG